MKYLSIVGMFIIILLSGCIEDVQEFTQLIQESRQTLADSENFLKAHNTNNIVYCDGITDEGTKFRCYDNLAIRTHTQTTCSKITDKYWQGTCISAVNGDFSFCEDLSSDSRDNCYFRMAIQSGNSDVCDEANTYMYSCYKHFSWHKGESLCDKISDEDYNHWCLAGALKNPTHCGKMVDRERGDLCYNQYVSLTGETFQCENIINEALKDNCIVDAAEFHNDKGLCIRTSSSYQKSFCEKAVDRNIEIGKAE